MGHKKHLIILVSALGVLLVGGFDYLTGWQLSFSIFYLAPILYATWYGSKNIGLALSLFSSGVWLVSDLLTSSNYTYVFIPYWNASVRLGFFVLLVTLLRKFKGRLEIENHLARTDYLTGVYNSRAFFEAAEAELARSRRHGRPFAIGYVDLDNFKAVNDSRGHDEGDRLLKALVTALKNNLRASDIAARMGGDELAVLFPETDGRQARVVIPKVQRLLAEKMVEAGWPVTVSVGVVTFSRNLPDNVQEMITAADTLMYEAKKQGKNRVVFSDYLAVPETSTDATIDKRVNSPHTAK